MLGSHLLVDAHSAEGHCPKDDDCSQSVALTADALDMLKLNGPTVHNVDPTNAQADLTTE